MKVIVFGATGTVGHHVIDQSLEKGHNVTAFCRDPQKIDVLHDNLKISQGDATNNQDVLSAITGHDAVVIVLGSGKQRKGNIRSAGTKTVINAMKEAGVQRLICQTTLGCGDSNPNLNFFWKYIMFGWFLKEVFLDHELQEQYVRESGLDWTIVRPGAFTDGEKSGRYQHGFGPKAKSLKLKISRADVADFLLKQLSSDQYRHKTPGLSY